MFGRKTTLALLTGGLVLAGSGAAVWAATPTPQAFGNEIHACVGDHGKLRLAFHNCRRFEDHISWNRQGPQGPPGPSLNTTPAQKTQPTGAYTVTTTMLPVTGLFLQLPTTGTYLISANVRGYIDYPAATTHDCFVTADLASGPGPTPTPGMTVATDSQRLVVIDINTYASSFTLPNGTTATPATTDDSNVQATAPIQAIVSGAAGSIVTVRAIRSTCTGASTVQIVTNVDGASTLNAVRIN